MRVVASLDNLHNLSPGLVNRFTTYIFDSRTSGEDDFSNNPSSQGGGVFSYKSCYGCGCGFKADDYVLAFLQ